MGRRLLIGCYEVPGWGGAATRAYLLFQRMQRDGWDVAYVNLVGAEDEGFLRGLFGAALGNPQALAGVHTCIVDDVRSPLQPTLTDLVGRIAPDLLLGVGFIAALLMKWAAAHLPLIFLTAGSRRIQHLIEAGAVKDFMGFQRSVHAGVSFPLPPDDRERTAAALSDLIIVHSPQVRLAFEYFVPEHAGKIYANTISVADLRYDEAALFARARKPFADRDIDVVFVASQWNRPMKNYALVRKIVARCAGLNVHIVGDADHPRLPVQRHGVLTRREDLYALLGRARTLVCPSLLDAAPGVLFEASAMGCNVITSPNCGNWQLCNEQLVAARGSTSDFVAAIARAQRAAYPDHAEHFRGGYADLVDTLSVV
jgi:glycosyltransferase involved in cell wall biosynthesis